jgi:hypothetical protein
VEDNSVKPSNGNSVKNFLKDFGKGINDILQFLAQCDCINDIGVKEDEQRTDCENVILEDANTEGKHNPEVIFERNKFDRVLTKFEPKVGGAGKKELGGDLSTEDFLDELGETIEECEVGLEKSEDKVEAKEKEIIKEETRRLEIEKLKRGFKKLFNNNRDEINKIKENRLKSNRLKSKSDSELYKENNQNEYNLISEFSWECLFHNVSEEEIKKTKKIIHDFYQRADKLGLTDYSKDSNKVPESISLFS